MSCIVLNPHRPRRVVAGGRSRNLQMPLLAADAAIAPPHSRSAKIFSAHFAARWEQTPRLWFF